MARLDRRRCACPRNKTRDLKEVTRVGIRSSFKKVPRWSHCAGWGSFGAKKRYQLPGLLPTRAWCCGQLPKLEEFPCFGARTWLKLLGRPAISKFEALAQDDCPTTRELFSNTDSYTSFLESAEQYDCPITRELSRIPTHIYQQLWQNTDSYTSFLESAENRLTRIPR